MMITIIRTRSMSLFRQSRAEQSRAEQSRAEQSRAEQISDNNYNGSRVVDSYVCVWHHFPGTNTIP